MTIGLRLRVITLVYMGVGILPPHVTAQSASLDVPTIAAISKGPNQINLLWHAVGNPGYGYLVEIQSDNDSRYSVWTELKPIPPAAGYQCDNSIQIRGGTCSISDPNGTHVYNPPTNGIPYWVTESTYQDPQDGSGARFIAAGLQPGASYSFRVRTYSGNSSTTYGDYSNTATATTDGYTVFYVSPTGNDNNDGTAADDGHAWRTLAYGSKAIGCGHVLIVKGGNYPSDQIGLSQQCSPDAKAVVLVNPGDTATITSVISGGDKIMEIDGTNVVVDGIVSAAAVSGNYAIEFSGSHNALLNVEWHPQVIPTQNNGVNLVGDHNLIYHSYLHDAFSPDATQNPEGNGGWVLTVQGNEAQWNVI